MTKNSILMVNFVYMYEKHYLTKHKLWQHNPKTIWDSYKQDLSNKLGSMILNTYKSCCYNNKYKI